jgi:hypothetical protein
MLHCVLLSKSLVIEIDEKKKTFEGLELGVRGDLAKFLCRNPTNMMVPQSGSWFAFYAQLQAHPKPFRGLLANSRSGHKRLMEQHF